MKHSLLHHTFIVRFKLKWKQCFAQKSVGLYFQKVEDTFSESCILYEFVDIQKCRLFSLSQL